MHRTLRTAIAMAVLVVALFCAATAHAGPAEETLDLATLNTKLLAASGGTLPGAMRTVLKGSEIETIPVTIMAVAGGPDAADALILFEATGTAIEKIGGIAAGMSGSPLLVDDGGTYKLVGAVSYGEDFTAGGTGLATPIDAMSAIESAAAARAIPLAKPVLTENGVVNQVIVTPDDASLSGLRPSGTLVARPLAAVYLGGLDTRSTAYRKLSARLRAQGATVFSASNPRSTGTGPGEGGFTAPLVGGAGVTALEAWGDLWAGALGTVTYGNGSTVVAFGHSVLGTGPSALAMTNAWVDGVWPSLQEPYKLGRPTAMRGTFTLDRSVGAVGTTSSLPQATPITATATDASTHETTTSAVSVPMALLADGSIGTDVIGAAASIATARLYADGPSKGSADITTTIDVTDGVTSYRIVTADLVDDAEDVSWAVAFDALRALDKLALVRAEGVEDVVITAVDVDATVRRSRRAAQIMAVEMLDPIHAGTNVARVSLRAYGVATTQTVDVPFTLPGNTPLTGSLTAKCVATPTDSGVDLPTIPPRPTLAKTVEDLNAALPYNAVSVVFKPEAAVGLDSEEDPGPTVDNATYESVTGTVLSPFSLTGSAFSIAPAMTLKPLDPIVPFGSGTLLTGVIAGAGKPANVTLWATPAGGVERLLGTVAAEPGETGLLEFSMPLDGLAVNTSVRARLEGGPTWTTAAAGGWVPVSADVYLSAARSVKAKKRTTLRAYVAPVQTAGGTVQFQVYNAKTRKWRAIGTASLTPAGDQAVAALRWKPARGTWKVRAVFTGGATNVSSVSGQRTVKAR